MKEQLRLLKFETSRTRGRRKAMTTMSPDNAALFAEITGIYDRVEYLALHARWPFRYSRC